MKITKSQLKQLIGDIIKEENMMDMGETQGRSMLTQNVLSSLDDAENMRRSLVADMEAVSDPAELKDYQKTLQKLDSIIADKESMIHSLSRGPTKLTKHLPEQSGEMQEISLEPLPEEDDVRRTRQWVNEMNRLATEIRDWMKENKRSVWVEADKSGLSRAESLDTILRAAVNGCSWLLNREKEYAKHKARIKK